MLSYQHGYHAGNFADVHKHTALLLALDHLRGKPTPFMALDTHAGRGRYDLASPEALKLGEWRDGVARVMAAPVASEGLRLYREAVRAFNRHGVGLTVCPGSPALAARRLRADDRLELAELHPREYAGLEAAVGRDHRVRIHREDGLTLLNAQVPPRERRGVVLIDPAYEVKTEFEAVAAALVKAVRKWKTGIYVVWYPILAEARHQALRRGLADLAAAAAIEVLVSETPNPVADKGLRGSGLVVLNPPFQFAERLEAARAEAAALPPAQ